MKHQSPTISIITIVYNAVDLLEGTIQSVIQQTYPNIEYIVVDGGSNDGTLQIIETFKNKINQWVSEPDKGLYDAMNNGLKMATGDFVWFMNAGDKINRVDTVEKMMLSYTPNTDVLYGEVMMVDEKGRNLGTRSEVTTHRLPKKLTWKSMAYGMVVCHQAILIRRNICPMYEMDNLTADIDWVIQALQHSRENTHSNLILAQYLTGGISKKRHQQSLKDRYQVLKKHFGVIPNFFNHIIIVGRAIIFRLARIGKDHY